ncbi:amidase signature domain-containing protein [Amylocystis lapponica]|nr:amidase signature domain-containing protein [Amylocystis lapponica]
MPRQDNLLKATGNAAYTAKVSTILADLDSQIPAALRLPPSILKDPPLDVTGVPASCGLLTPEELAITELDATAIVEKIAKGEMTAVETVSAFGKRAAIAHQLTACLTDFFLDEGIATAKALDEYYKREGKVIGPLHGLPISIKSYIRVKGRRGFGGFLANFEVSSEDSDMTAVLRSLGAVFYVKTNQPQTIMHLESHSFYGRTLNPWNTNLTPGGSSGGEAALIAMKGSCFGIGSDGGGSIRNPSANTGLHGMRPTAKTTPVDNQIWYISGQSGFGTSTGPMCRSNRDIAMFFAAINSAKPAPSLIDPALIPLAPVVPNLTGAKLRVGIMMHDGVVLPHPPTLRALTLAKEKLLAAPNIEVVDYTPYQHDRGYTIIRSIYYEDGGQGVRKMCADGGEDLLPLTEWVISPPITRDHTTAEMWELHGAADTFRREYSDHWNGAGIDVLLCAPFPGTANPHDTAKYWGYTAIFNLVDYPGFVFPTGLRADPAVDVPTEPFAPMSPADAFNHSLYVPGVFVGAPVSLQLVARRFNDGLLIAAQKVVEDIIRA